MVAQEDGPLAAVGDLGRLRQYFDNRVAVFLRDRHVHARHQREVISHLAFVAVAEVLAHVFRPHVGLGEQQPARVVGLDARADLFDHRVRLAQVLVAGAVALDQVGDRIETETVDTHLEPELHRLEHGLEHGRVVEVEVGLVAEEAVPEVLLRDLVPGPVRFLGVGEDDARAGVERVVVAPDVEVALGRALGRAPRRLEPRVLVGGVVHHQLGDHAQAAPVGLDDERAKVGQRAVVRVHVFVVRDVVAVVALR